MTPVEQPRHITAAEWAAVILGEQGPWTAMASLADGTRKVQLFTTPDQINEAKLQDVDVWVGMARLRADFVVVHNQRGKESDVESIKSLWLDVDIAGAGHKTDKQLARDLADVERLLATFPHPPTCIVHTGGGVHAYWSFVEPLERAEAAHLLARWGEHWQATGDANGIHVDAVFDLARIMRIPNTRNHKTDTPRPVVIIEWSPATLYNPSDLEDHLTERATAPSPTRSVAASVGYIGPKRPGDHFVATVPCSEVLDAHGWTLDRTNPNGDQQWRRPGKERRNGTSATVYAADGRCVIWTDAATGLQARDSLNSYRLYAKLSHGGDFAAAARELARLGYGERFDPTPIAKDNVNVGTAAPWPAPIPLGHSHALPPFPVHIFPAWIAEHVEAAALDIKVPKDLPAMLALAALSTVCTQKVAVRYAPHRLVHVNLFIAVTLPPSTGKSPAFSAMIQCVKDLELELREESADRIAKAEMSKTILERKMKDALTRSDLELMNECRLEINKLGPLVMPQLVVQDVTQEALVKILFEQKSRISLLSPEGGVFKMMTGRYSDKASLDEYLHAWAGEDITVNRKGSESYDVRKALMTIGVTIQPDVLRELAASQLQGSGLSQRFMYSVPKSLVGKRDYLNPMDEDPQIRLRYDTTMKQLGRRLLQYANAGEWRVTPEARRAHNEWVQRFEVRRGETGDMKDLAEWLGKVETSVIRAAGLLCVAWSLEPTGVIDVDDIKRAIELGDYWIEHSRAVHDVWDADPDVAKAKSVVAWLADNRLEKFSIRQLHNARHSMFKKADDTIPVLSILAERGWVRPLFDGPITTGKRGTPSPEFEVHPDVFRARSGQNAPSTTGSSEHVAHVAPEVEALKEIHSLTPPETLSGEVRDMRDMRDMTSSGAVAAESHEKPAAGHDAPLPPPVDVDEFDGIDF